MTFSCPNCETPEFVVGYRHRAFDDFPEGWYLGCAKCKTRWFMSFVLPQVRNAGHRDALDIVSECHHPAV